jgi:hypothetical protein
MQSTALMGCSKAVLASAGDTEKNNETTYFEGRDRNSTVFRTEGPPNKSAYLDYVVLLGFDAV